MRALDQIAERAAGLAGDENGFEPFEPRREDPCEELRLPQQHPPPRAGRARQPAQFSEHPLGLRHELEVEHPERTGSAAGDRERRVGRTARGQDHEVELVWAVGAGAAGHLLGFEVTGTTAVKPRVERLPEEAIVVDRLRESCLRSTQ